LRDPFNAVVVDIVLAVDGCEEYFYHITLIRYFYVAVIKVVVDDAVVGIVVVVGAGVVVVETFVMISPKSTSFTL